MKNVKKLDGREQENFYDGEGLRAGIKEAGNVSVFVFKDGEILAECNGDGVPVRRNLQGAGLSYAQTMNDGAYHAYHQDEQGSTAYITGKAGTVENCYAYDAFGNMLESRETIDNRILYTGQQYDQETGQYYLRARFYNPAVGRFMQEDTYRGDGLNLYAYCGNNPVMYYDPSGHLGEVLGQCTIGDQANYNEQETQITPTEVNTFGNASEPRGARPEKDFGANGFDDIVGPESGPFPKGASTFDNIDNVPLSGHYYTLPEGTELPDGLGIIADGIDVNESSPHGQGHYTIYPTKEMTVTEFNELFKSLPWSYGGKKK